MASFFLSSSTFLPLPSSYKLFLSLHHDYSPHLSFNNFQYPLRKHLTFTLCASSLNKSSRSRRKVKSNEELRNDLREFLSGVGLPNDHVPTMKELLEHGRNDLANIVRRRGYKFVGELLAKSTKTDSDDFIAEEGLPESPSCSGVEEKASTSFNIEGQHEEKNIAENISSSNDVSIVESYPSSSNVELSPNFFQYHYTSPKASPNLTLEEKVSNFVQNGDLDDVYGIFDERDAKVSKEVAEGGNKSGIPGAEHLHRVYKHTAVGGVALNGSALTSNKLASSETVNHPLRDDGLAAEELISADFDKDLDIETGRIENQLEIDNLKSMLQQKEFELSRLKEQIEKEQHALSVLQTKAETEITKAQQLISAKDAELNAVEESFSGLEEVEIQYSGDGEIVEVAGSFNGWHQLIKMDPKPSSSIIENIGSRKSRTWSTVLWLYPGMYEIKFVVDGEWKTDPQRESVTRGGILNNILRVNR
ncbi:protein PTST homolog 3, chloroplastic isoform X2 [Mangifera indica]|uniref:protein PTST homolog 3, chloroplastic isoform X2 n=1 Tax=Mangifera indica TaxID=29780 RepID=UPI001CFA37F2|nr:protein PTST homolog 3, chloroplastic isoform X2 [Mangifera indica]